MTVLDDADFALFPGQSVALVAPSGTGKSTLLHIAGLLERPDGGEVFIDGVATIALCRRCAHGAAPQRDRLRLPVPSSAAGILGDRERHAAADDRRAFAAVRRGRAALELLDYLGLAARAKHRPGGISGGEQQRVAIARAVANAPGLLLADEPTGNLDPHTADHVFTALETLVQATGLATLVATHSQALAARMTRRVTLDEGHVREMD